MALQSIKYFPATSSVPASLQLLDQRKLPLSEVFVDVTSLQQAHEAIQRMVVRGAPAIAIAAALALAVELQQPAADGKARFGDGAAAAQHVRESADYLVSSRPTAVNLAELAGRLKAAAAVAAGAGAAAVVSAVVAVAEAELASDVATNRSLGLHGATALRALRADGGGVRVLTHCNTGSLATAGYGTALGCVRALREAGALAHAYCTETRPYNQGARLTAYELVTDSLTPATLLVDSAAAALMASGAVDAVVVGADRVAANGDTANKVGTLSLATCAARFGVPFFVAAPCTSCDPETASGADIRIEERPAEEVTHARGGERVTPLGIDVYNPGFDVTPASLIAGIITEKGVLRPGAAGTFDVPGLLRGHPARAGPAALDCSAALAYVAERPELAARLGGAGPAEWTAAEVGDGNINFVYVCRGPSGALVLKQALPYIRLVGESWPLGTQRLAVEASALRAQRAACEPHTPEIFAWDGEACILAMRYIEPPHALLRSSLIQGDSLPLLAEHMARFLAETLFRTSPLALGGPAFRAAAAALRNEEMCALTEQVVFTSPYHSCSDNRHTSPQLDSAASALRVDAAAKAAVAALRLRFKTVQQALCHGDLHTGSVMACAHSTFVFDSEFAFYGPIGFDVAAFLANLLLALFASPGLERQAAASGGGGGCSRARQRDWLLATLVETHARFVARFCALWAEAAARCELLGVGGESLVLAQASLMRSVFVDALGFAGAKMVRRIVGIAHVADLEAITDPDERARCESVALAFGRRLLVQAECFDGIDAVAAEARYALAPLCVGLPA